MPSLIKKVGEGIKHRWDERQEDKQKRALIDSEIKEKRQEAFYDSYRSAKMSSAIEEGKASGKRSAQGRHIPKLNIDMGKLAKGGASATAGLNFLSKDIFGGSGSTNIFGTRKKGKRQGGAGGAKTVTVKADGTRITVRSSGAEGEGAQHRERSISENIEGLLDLGNLSPPPQVNGHGGNKKGKKRKTALEEMMEF